jgi:hypothetical protein
MIAAATMPMTMRSTRRRTPADGAGCVAPRRPVMIARVLSVAAVLVIARPFG